MSREIDRKKLRRVSAREWAEKQNKYENTIYTIPEGVDSLAFAKPGKYKIDVIPYITGNNNPMADPGMLLCGRIYYVHRNLGGDGKQRYCCRFKTWGLPCPICKFIATLDYEDQKPFRAQQRLLCNVIDLDGRNDNIQLLDQPFGTVKHPSFGQLLNNKLDAIEDSAYFYELTKEDGGRTLQLTVAKGSMPGATFMQVVNIEMIARKKDYPDSILNEVVALDDILIDFGEEKLKEIMENGIPDTKEDTEENPEPEPEARGRRTEPKEEEDESASKEEDDSDWGRKKRKSSVPILDDEDDDEEIVVEKPERPKRPNR